LASGIASDQNETQESRLVPRTLSLKIPNPFKPRYPRLDWIQVEITSFCNSGCLYCPQRAYRNRWDARQLPLEAFATLLPALKRTRLVYLQGWGEPFLHPGFFEMLRIGKSAGARVGTTTNGTLLDPSAAERLAAGGLDIIAFSLAGISPENDRIRNGTSLKAVLKSIEDLHRARNRHGVRSPAIHVAFLILRSQIDEIDRMPDFFANLGVDQVVVSSLSLVTSPDWSTEAILADTPEQWAELQGRIQQVREAGASRGVDIHFQLASPRAGPSPCDENVSRALVVGANGDISPCVMTNIPVKDEAACYFDRQPYPLPRLRFGNIGNRTIREIWHQRDYRAFRRQWAGSNLPDLCRRCYKSRFVRIETPVAGPAYNLVPDL